MPTELVNLNLEELSLVDKGANQFAKAPIFKADTSKGVNMTTETTEKMSDDMKAKLKPYMDKGMSEAEAMKAYEDSMKKSQTEDLEAQVETLKAENEKLRKGLLDEGYVIKAEGIEKKAPAEFIEYGGEKINKADVPAPILKALEEAEIEKADNALTKRAEEKLPHFSADVAKKLLVAVDKSDDTDALMEALMAADKAFSDKMEEFGKSDVNGDFSDANDKLEKMAKAHQESNGGTYATAYASVTKTDAGKALIKEIYKKD